MVPLLMETPMFESSWDLQEEIAGWLRRPYAVRDGPWRKIKHCKRENPGSQWGFHMFLAGKTNPQKMDVPSIHAS